MSNINFDNPWMLIVGFVLLLLIILAFVLTINKENRNKKNITSFILHIVICLLVTFSLAGTKFEKVITETNIYVLADVSYSANRNLDLIDDYIEELKESAPNNSKIGIVCFGNDYQLLVNPGEKLQSVKNAKIDDSQTNIAKALEYTAGLFKENVIKRIVIISDGKETTKSNIVTLVQNLSLDNIYVDAIYLDNNLKENEDEVQISSVDYLDSTYVDVKEEVYVLLQSNTKSKGYLDLYHNGELKQSKAISLDPGNNTETFALDTTEEGIQRYELKVRMDNDKSEYNNSYQFTQDVVKQINILVVGSNTTDQAKIDELYASNASIDYYINNPNVPFNVEELCKYDEFILSDIDVRKLNNAGKFISSLDILVSEFGKSLTTFGNTYIQNNYDDSILSSLSDMLPVKFGTGEQEEKLVTLVLDISRSMEQISKFHIAKECCNVILDNLSDNVKVMVYVFYGKNYMAIEPTPASSRESIKAKINDLSALQGTIMGGALKEVYQKITSLAYSKNEVILISDGLPYGSSDEEKNIMTYASKLALANVSISTIHVVTEDVSSMDLMKEIAKIGRGYYYYIKELSNVKNLILNDVLNNLNEVLLVDNESSVQIVLYKDDLVRGIESLPNISGLYNNQKKASSTVVLNALYKDKENFEYEVPLYSYWEYGQGLVSSYSSTLTGEWTSKWNDNEANQFYQNALIVNRPDKSIDSAFIVSHTPSSVSTEITVLAPSINKDSVLTMIVTNPDNTKVNKEFVFNGEYYVSDIESTQIGEYKIDILYKLGEQNYTTEYLFNVSYLPEYNSFTVFEASNLYYMVSTNGKISEDGHLILENNESIVQKYIIEFTPIFMIICAILFIIDIIIRKLRLEDLKSLFRFKRFKNSRK